MKILGIETSCDETAAAVVENGNKILSSSVATSAQMHAKTGGIIPENAAREQLKSILSVIKTALDDSQLAIDEIDALAVTIGPGLIGSLLVGVETAKTLGVIYDKPLIIVNHLVAHLYGNWLNTNKPPKLPALGLVVSGGHTDLVLLKDHGNLKLIGTTRDDAAGEAFDKTARLIGLPYPGGPKLASLADQYIKDKPHQILDLLPRPMIDQKNFDFSFSGLKTAVINLKRTQKEIKDTRLAAEVQAAIVEVLVEKSVRAIKKFQPQSFLLAGGVAANKALRKKLDEKVSEEKLSTDLHIPDLEYCTDNATYIASCAYFNQIKLPIENAYSVPNLKITDSYDIIGHE